VLEYQLTKLSSAFHCFALNIVALSGWWPPRTHLHTGDTTRGQDPDESELPIYKISLARAVDSIEGKFPSNVEAARLERRVIEVWLSK